MKANFFSLCRGSKHLKQRIFFVTDIEGDIDFFKKSVCQSQTVMLSPDKGLSFIGRKNEVPRFIFGGDFPDRMPHDLELGEMLIDFKKRHPDQVVLLAGNRDISKNRIHIELNETHIKTRLLQTPTPRWIKNGETTPKDYVLQAMKSQNYQGAIEDYVHALSIRQCQSIYLRWMLEKTMGCPNTFLFRKQELQKRNPLSTIDDELILESFIKESRPDGLYGQYLKLAQLGVIIPEARLIAVHGGLHPNNIGRVPGMSPEEYQIELASVWIHRLNTWYRKQVALWEQFDTTTLTPTACTELDEFALPLSPNKQIMTSDYLNSKRQFIPIPIAVVEYLEENQLQIVLGGHQPCGDHPAIIRDETCLVINGDTGYSNPQGSLQGGTRGLASSCLEVVAHCDSVDLQLQAMLSDGQKVTTKFGLHPGYIKGDSYVGLVSNQHELVQCKLESGNYRLIQQNGFNVEYKERSLESIEMLFPTVLPGYRK